MAIPPKEELHRIHSVQVERARSILAGFVREHPLSEKQPSASTSRGLEAEFSEMESSMLQVRDLFTQISLLVMTQVCVWRTCCYNGMSCCFFSKTNLWRQGSALDTIDAHVQQSQRIVMDGQSKLATASKKKKRRRKVTLNVVSFRSKPSRLT